MAPLVRTGGSRHTGLAALPHRNIHRKNISDKEAFARLLLKMYKENSFHSIKFSTDHGYATSLDMTVYSWKEDIENGKSFMQIEFRPIEYGKDYDIVHNPDKYVLFIDGKEIID